MKTLNAGRLLSFISQKAIEVPIDGWDAETWAISGDRVMLAIRQTALVSYARDVPPVAAEVRDNIEAAGDRTAEIALLVGVALLTLAEWRTIIAFVLREPDASGLVSDIHLALSPLLRQALGSATAQAAAAAAQTTSLTAAEAVVSRIQSTYARGYDRTGRIINPRQTEALSTNDVIREARQIARNLSRIDRTTRTNLERVVEVSIREGDSVSITAEKLREHVHNTAASRGMTVARTELNNAWTLGSVQSYRRTPKLKELSVIGCQAREKNSPHYRGQSTCNYHGLPVAELPAFLAVGWHPCHTGTLVASSFFP